MKYRRVPHQVRAELLAERWDWTTASGDTLAAAPGNYRITDPSTGHQWSATAQALHTGYREIAPGVFESRGEVTARQVTDSEGPVDVPSLEGPEVARVGDWIVTDPDGGSWVVEDGWFRMRYQEVNQRFDGPGVG